MYAAVPFIVVIAWLTLCYVVLRVLGLRLSTYWGMSAEKVVAWRRLRRWQYIAIHRILVFGMALFAFNMTWDYEDGKINLFYLQEHHIYLPAILLKLAFCIGAGLIMGFISWKRIWDPKFDVPQGTAR